MHDLDKPCISVRSQMKKLFLLLVFPSLVSAGEITTHYGSGGGSIVISSGAAASHPAPTNPAISAVYQSSISATWTSVSSENGYTLDASTTNFSGGTTVSSVTTNGASTGLTVVSLSASTTYYVKAGSRWTDGTTTYTATASTRTKASGVEVDSRTISGISASGSPKQWNMTFTGSNRYVLVDCVGVNSTVTGITVGGTSASLIQNHTNGTSHSAMYGLAAPAEGSQQISVSFSAGDDSNMNCGAISLTGVNQSSPVDVSTAAYVNGEQYATIARDTTADNVMIVDMVYRTANTACTPDGSQTSQYAFPNSSQGVWSGGSTKLVGAAGSQSTQWNVGWSAAILTWVAIKPAP